MPIHPGFAISVHWIGGGGVNDRFRLPSVLSTGAQTTTAAAARGVSNHVTPNCTLCLVPTRPCTSTSPTRSPTTPATASGTATCPKKLPFRTRGCACGCGETTAHDFVPGHELRAIQARVREHFGGSALAFITWLDAELPPAAQAA